jgi:hypothetical protein
MRRTLMLVCWVLIMAILQSSCGGGRSTLPPSAPPPTTPSSTVPTPTLLRTLYRVVNGSDRITTIGPDERSSYPLEGQVYYVPDQPASGRTTLTVASDFHPQFPPKKDLKKNDDKKKN